MSVLTLRQLVDDCRDDSFASGLLIASAVDPLEGPGSPVKPAIYEGGKYQHDRRWVGEGDDRRATDAVVIDNVPSQANRLEAALAVARDDLGLPELVLDLSAAGPLPAHLPTAISSFLFPHRNADAYLRDASLKDGGVDFPKSEIGKAVFDATADRPEPLLAWMPQSLLYGFWQSHLGKKGSQAKFARCWVSEIVGYDPATTTAAVMGLKGDPLNLSIGEAVEFDPNDPAGWTLSTSKKAGGRSQDSLAELGHGQVPVGNSPAAISFRQIEQRSSLSFAGLRRINTSAEGRALLAALGVAAHVYAFGRAMTLRSRCDLRAVNTNAIYLGSAGDEPFELPDRDGAKNLLAEAVDAARSAGHALEGWGRPPLELVPNASLLQVIKATYPVLDS